LADFSTYATCLTTIGFDTPGSGYYLVGFKTGVAAAAVTGACTATDTPTITPLVTKYGVAFPTTLTDASTATAGETFTAAAEANLGKSGTASTANDRWTINQAKTLTNTNVGF
jgi:hypothetical protein